MNKSALLAATFLWFSLTGALAQDGSDFAIDSIGLDRDAYRIDLYIRAIQNGIGVALKKEDDELIVTETIDGKTATLAIDEIIHKTVEEKTIGDRTERLQILILTGVGSGISPEMATRRKALIEKILDELGPSAISSDHILISTYGDQVSTPQPLNPADQNQLFSDLDNRPDQHAELYRGIVESTRYMREKGGKWAFFVLTDGLNDYDPGNYIHFLPYDTADVQFFLKQLSLNTYVLPIGIGDRPNTDLLRLMVQASGNPADTFAISSLPSDIARRIVQKVAIKYNNIARCRPLDPRFKYSQPRKYTARWIGNNLPGVPDSVSQVLLKDFNLRNVLDESDWVVRWAYGLLSLFGVLGVMIFTVPWLERWKFRRKYVHPYQATPGRIQRDPVTRDELQSGQLVVTKCSRQTTSLESWEFVGNKCPNYPKCLDLVDPCDGSGAPSGQDKFFEGKGINRQLNWLWFGMVGGFLSWTIFALINIFGFGWYNAILTRFWGTSFGAGDRTGQVLEAHIEALTNNTLLGAAFGAGICLMLSLAENRSQPRRVSWLRIAGHTVFGLMAALLVFLFGFFIQYKGWVSSLWVSGLITWLLFGLSIGVILSVRSTISLKRGVLGGLGAALMGYVVYAIGNTLTDYDFATVKLISFIVLGGLLGLTLVTIVTRLEDFELEYLSPPEQFKRVDPISKWLKNGVDIFIGRESGNYVYVKWDDEVVEPYHARLFYDNGLVYIEPLAETLLNGKPLPAQTNTPLRNGDVIQLGRGSITRMRYREKLRPDSNGQMQRPAQGGFRINN